MTEDLQAFVDQFLAPDKPPRDGSGRPLLIPRGKELVDENRIPYTRASSLGDILEDFSYLWKWKLRGAAKGIADSMDLVRLIAAETYTCGFAPDEQANREAGRRIDDSIERAMDRAGVSMKADYGTAIHSRTEPDTSGTDPDEKQRIDVASCWDLWRTLGVTHLGTEIFTACDATQSAGTFDHLSYVPGLGIIVTDKKTSSKASSTYDVQLGGYANGDVYDKDTDQRMTLEEYIESVGWNPALLNRDVGLIWWIKNGRTQARQLDLKNGYRWALVAASIRDERRKQGVAKDVTKRLAQAAENERDIVMNDIRASQSVDELLAIWNSPQYRSVWTDEHTAAATAKKEALS